MILSPEFYFAQARQHEIRNSILPRPGPKAGMAGSSLLVLLPAPFTHRTPGLASTKPRGPPGSFRHQRKYGLEEDKICGAIETAGPYLGHLHMGENNRKPPGYGHIPWEEVGAALQSIHFEGWVVMEPFISREWLVRSSGSRGCPRENHGFDFAWIFLRRLFTGAS
jgi:hypothetical protein